ncbi:MAG: polyprenyl synthetase family protein [Thermodesulfobacteriaceae bacterium]|nr:polyprenyl synthetase family protein [Thermodesulfobacteriaceae bacterium]MCX8041848.1 polyprenyl synthetase family protein [Thermodesulfobacteriaceae bacterium]MDW8135665.1 polyprenyl synthetase family protein [Thermodesulfobacterium sp.]
MEKAQILEAIKAELTHIEKTLKFYLNSHYPFINQVSEYIIFSGGKRIRPLLSVLSAKLFLDSKKDLKNEALIYQTSIIFEYLHAATLLHDDVVDSAEFRRGRKAARNLWGNQATILVGDYLYAKSLRIASSLKNSELMEVITETTLLMSEGEILQLLNLDNTSLTVKDYEEVIFRKTAVLISACCEVGSILGGANLKERKALKEYGKALGMAFQIIDDLLDYTSLETGKELGKDFKEGKVTLPLIYALENALPEEKKRLLYLLKNQNTSEKDFLEAKFLIEKNKGFLETLKRAKYYVNKAKESLHPIPENFYKTLLLFISDYLLERKK